MKHAFLHQKWWSMICLVQLWSTKTLGSAEMVDHTPPLFKKWWITEGDLPKHFMTKSCWLMIYLCWIMIYLPNFPAEKKNWILKIIIQHKLLKEGVAKIQHCVDLWPTLSSETMLALFPLSCCSLFSLVSLISLFSLFSPLFSLLSLFLSCFLVSLSFSFTCFCSVCLLFSLLHILSLLYLFS